MNAAPDELYVKRLNIKFFRYVLRVIYLYFQTYFIKIFYIIIVKELCYTLTFFSVYKFFYYCSYI